MTTLLNKYESIFKEKPTHHIFSPGRVNLIGEHTDYSGGMVFPMALSLGINGVYRKRNDDLVAVYSDQFKDTGVLFFSLNDLTYEQGFNFGNYVKGTLFILEKNNHKLKQGFNLYLSSSLPPSSGLSSSAALEMLVIGLYQSLSTQKIDSLKAIKYAKAVENDYFHLSSGIMDQFAVQFGKENYAMFLDTKTLKVKYTPLDLTNYTLYLMNTNKKRNLENSNYNERFESVNIGEKKLKDKFSVTCLGDVTKTMFDAVDEDLLNEVVYKRIRHVVTENERVKQAFHALNKYDMKSFGEYLYESHVSLKNDFDVSCQELDYLVEENRRLGAVGARMTGAGFGGTMIALYHKEKLPKAFESLKKSYYDLFNKPLDIYKAKSSDGVSWEVIK